MLTMKTLINWVVLLAFAVAMTGAVFLGVNTLENSAWMTTSPAHASLGVMWIIAGVALLNVAIMIGIGICATLSRE